MCEKTNSVSGLEVLVDVIEGYRREFDDGFHLLFHTFQQQGGDVTSELQRMRKMDAIQSKNFIVN